MNDPHGQHRLSAYRDRCAGAKRGPIGSARGKVLGDRDEGVRLDQHDMLPAALHDASFLPGTWPAVCALAKTRRALRPTMSTAITDDDARTSAHAPASAPLFGD